MHHESRRRAMARVAEHLSVDDLEARLRSAQDPTATRHFQVIWLLARGHTIADVAAVTSFVPRWIEQLPAWCTDRLAGAEELGGVGERPFLALDADRALQAQPAPSSSYSTTAAQDHELA